MFDKNYEERLSCWSEFRDSLETSSQPFKDLIRFYKTVPYVSIATDPWDQKTWLDPWELIFENQYCDFSRVLGMCYSLQLTARFSAASFEIHIGIDHSQSKTYYLLYVDEMVLGFDEDDAVHIQKIPDTVVSQRVYSMPRLH